MVAIARRNLFSDLPRFLVAQAGIVFAVSLVTIQTGILAGFTRSTSLPIEESNADIWVSADTMVYFELTDPLSLGQVEQARQVDGVERAEALLLGSGRWDSSGGQLTPLRLFGFDPAGTLFSSGDLVAGNRSDLETPRNVIVDDANLDTLGVNAVGNTAEIGPLPVRVAGITRDTQSIASSAFVYASLETATEYVATGTAAAAVPNTPPATPLPPSSPITYILIQAAPGVDQQSLKLRLQDALPGTLAYTRAEMVERTQTYWTERTGIGFILGLGAAVGTIVGVVIVGQILYSSVSDRLRDFGTLKAMGASDWVVYGIIVRQALWMAVLGYVPGMALCWGLRVWTMSSQGIAILITPVTMVGVFGVTVAMCVCAAIFAIQKVTRVDPGMVFKS
jgi:putative ABC transport system permease protein